MSIRRGNGCRDLLVRSLELAEKPMPYLRIAEFGNQRIKPDGDGMRLVSAKSMCEFLGAAHLSIDLNGRDGAVRLDKEYGEEVYVHAILRKMAHTPFVPERAWRHPRRK